jgi:hypothetical protein
VSWTAGPVLFASGEERTLNYYWGTPELPEWRGPQIAFPHPSKWGGAFVATAQGSQQEGPESDEIRYLVTIKNFGGAGTFTLYGGGLT